MKEEEEKKKWKIYCYYSSRTNVQTNFVKIDNVMNVLDSAIYIGLSYLWNNWYCQSLGGRNGAYVIRDPTNMGEGEYSKRLSSNHKFVYTQLQKLLKIYGNAQEGSHEPQVSDGCRN